MRAADRDIDLRVARLRKPAIGDVPPQGVVEQRHLLRHEGDLRAQALERVVLERLAVEQDGPARDVVEARDQAGERRLARARTPHQRHRLPGLHGEGHVPQRVTYRALVPERDIAKLDAATRAIEGPLSRVRLGGLVELPEDILGRCESALQAGIHLGELLDGIRHEARVADVGDQVPRRHGAGHVRLEQQSHQQRERQRHEQLYGLGADGLRRRHLQILPAIAIARRHEAVALGVLAPERAHHAIAGHGFRRDVRDVAHRSLYPPADAAKTPRRKPDDHADHRRHRQEDQRQHPVRRTASWRAGRSPCRRPGPRS